jgi:hypothetical protein
MGTYVDRAGGNGIFTRDWIFYRGPEGQSLCSQRFNFGAGRATHSRVRGKESRGSLRGLRAGPASFPRLIFPRRNSFLRRDRTAGIFLENSSDIFEFRK